MKNKQANWKRHYDTIRVTQHGDLLLGYKVAHREGKEIIANSHFEVLVMGDNPFPEEKDYPATWFEEDLSTTFEIPAEYSRNLLYYNPQLDS